MYNVYANVGLFGFGNHFVCSHRLHVLEILYSTFVAKVRTRAHHDTFKRLKNPY